MKMRKSKSQLEEILLRKSEPFFGTHLQKTHLELMSYLGLLAVNW